MLAFETMEKIVREFFPYITETESMTFTDCVQCLLTFTNSRFDSDVSLNAIAFLRYCAVKLAEGGLISNEDIKDDKTGNVEVCDIQISTNKDENVSFWMPLLAGKLLLINLIKSFRLRGYCMNRNTISLHSFSQILPKTMSVIFIITLQRKKGKGRKKNQQKCLYAFSHSIVCIG